MKTHPYSQTVWYIPTLGFMGEHLNEHPGKIRNKKNKNKNKNKKQLFSLE